MFENLLTCTSEYGRIGLFVLLSLPWLVVLFATMQIVAMMLAATWALNHGERSPIAASMAMAGSTMGIRWKLVLFSIVYVGLVWHFLPNYLGLIVFDRRCSKTETTASSVSGKQEQKAVMQEKEATTSGQNGAASAAASIAVGEVQTGVTDSPMKTPAIAAEAHPSESSVPLTTIADPSFDCARALTQVERMICGDSSLADLDRKLAAAYAVAVQATKDPETLKVDQIQWIRERNRCLSTECVRDSYEMRTRALVGPEAR